jgi:hypothetical protein
MTGRMDKRAISLIQIAVVLAFFIALVVCFQVGVLRSEQDAGAGDAPVGADGIIGKEDRKLLSEFTLDGVVDQAAMRASLAATQRLSCSDGAGSASLIYRRDVIIFSAHQLLKDEARHSHELDDCVFVVTNRAGETDHYPLLLTTLDHGVPTPASQEDETWNRGNQDDWAIARLARPVTGIEPYRLPDQAEVGAPGSAVTTISDTTDNWRGSNGMIAQNCHVIATGPQPTSRYRAVMHLDCDVGRGASGSAILQDVASGSPRYIATTIAYTGNHCREAGLASCFSIGRRLDADLVARIKGTTALRSTAEDLAFGAAQDARLAAGRNLAAAQALAAVSAAFPAQGDEAGRKTAELYARIKNLVADGHAEQTDALFLEIYRLLHDPAQNRPEWPRLLTENGESMLRQHRLTDAFECFHSADAIAPEALKPYLQLRMAQTAADPKLRKKTLRDAYLVGGDGLFQAAKADAELAEVKADGLSTGDQ